MAETTRHDGCHCGAVQFTLNLDRDGSAMSCNCSMCSRACTLLSFVQASRFQLERGACGSRIAQ